MSAKTALIVAMDRNRLIGAGGALPWHLSADLKYFRRITMGCPIIMGRKTHDSIGRQLPGRTNIVVSSNPDYLPAEGCHLAASIEQALELASEVPERMIIGGAGLYQHALPFADRLYVTEVDTEAEGDVYFPDFNRSEWHERARESHPADDNNEHPYAFVVLERKD